MFNLVINYQDSLAVTAHPSREVALGELLRFLDSVDSDYRVAQASWEHSSYKILDNAQAADFLDTRPLVTGHAVIEESCACQHPHDEHDEGGCTTQAHTAGRLTRCACPAYQPITGEPALFDVDDAQPRSTRPRAVS